MVLMAAISLAGCQPPETPTKASRADDGASKLLARCISEAKRQGYRSGQCAYSFIKRCVETQSTSEMNSVRTVDSQLGIITSSSCPNMPSTYTADFDKF